MSSAFENVLTTIIKAQGRLMTYDKDHGFETESLMIAPANFFRNLAAPEEIVFEGKEFVIAKRSFDNSSFTNKFPERSDRIIDPDLGDNSISEVREMFAGGQLIGYRVRTA